MMLKLETRLRGVNREGGIDVKTYLNFLFVQVHALDDFKTRLLVWLVVATVCLFENHLVFGPISPNQITISHISFN